MRGLTIKNIVKYVSVLVFVFLPFALSKHRSKRFLLFPRSAPTRIQLIAGFGVPVDLEIESLTIGYVYKAEYFLPWNVTSLYNVLEDPFKLYPIPGEGGRRIQRSIDSEIPEQIINKYVEQDKISENHWYDQDGDGNAKGYSLEDIKIQSEQNLAQSRFTVYKGLEKLAETSGVPGRPCLLRSICETAEAPFSYSNGILGELAHLIMTPSSTVDELSEHADYEYLKAEQLGNAGEPCSMIFKECSTSLLNKFSGIYQTLNIL